MSNLNEKYISLLKDTHSIDSNHDALLILEAINTLVPKDKLESFITNDLCVFDNRDNAFHWFFDDEYSGSISIDDIDFEVDLNMAGRNIKDILLDGKENYIPISDNIHLTYWM